MRNGCRRLRLAGTALIVAAALGTAAAGPALASGSGQLRPGAGSLGGPFVALGDSSAPCARDDPAGNCYRTDRKMKQPAPATRQ